MTLIINHDESDEKKSRLNFSIKIPPKVLKRGRPKGAEVTVIGLRRKKKEERKS